MVLRRLRFAGAPGERSSAGDVGPSRSGGFACFLGAPRSGGPWVPGALGERSFARLLWDWRAAAVPHGCLLGLGGVACDGVPGRTSVRLGWPCTREPNSGEGRAPASGVGSWGLEGPDAWFARPRRSLAKSSARVLRWASLLMGRFVGPARSAGPALRLRRWCGGVRGGAAAGLLQFRRSPRGR
jgi:hypothetical protein